MKCCAECQYWEKHPREHGEVMEVTIGECHRYPPIVPVLNETILGDVQMTSYVPAFAGNWCGEFKKKKDK